MVWVTVTLHVVHVIFIFTLYVEQAHLPKEKLRVVHGAWNPVTLLQLVAAGFDMFDASLPYVSTERGSAFTFSFNENVRDSHHAPPNGKSKGVWYEISLEDDM